MVKRSIWTWPIRFLCTIIAFYFGYKQGVLQTNLQKEVDCAHTRGIETTATGIHKIRHYQLQERTTHNDEKGLDRDKLPPCPPVNSSTPTSSSETRSNVGLRSGFSLKTWPGIKSELGYGSLGVSNAVRSYDHSHIQCPASQAPLLEQNTFVYKNPEETSVLTSVFGYLHHPSCPVTAELVMSFEDTWTPDFSTCRSVYMIRTGSRDDQPTKCIGVVRAQEDPEKKIFHHSPRAIQHRSGHIDWPQVLTDQYQDDIIHPYSYKEQKDYTWPFLESLNMLVKKFIHIVGNPIDKDGNRKTSIIMVANEGVMDLVLNFMCSGDAAGIDLSTFVVFVGQSEYVDLVHSMGAKAFYDHALGEMPKIAAANYADRTFSKIMWLKITSVYLALKAGFNVVFQDADVVWMKDPIPYLIAKDKYDMVFMDDGARTPRFAPFFTNTGFYFVRRNEKTIFLMERMILSVGEISYTASHQATLIRHLTEAHYLFGLHFLVLDDFLFPSGRAYHEQRKFVNDVIAHKLFPFVWHMCWTASRADKVKYLKHLGLWFLPPPETYKGMCESSQDMLLWVQHNSNKPGLSIKKQCCMKGGYWENRVRKNLEQA